jgi:O-antigen ligase
MQIDLPFNPWWTLWIAAVAGSWLLPTHIAPWTAYHHDLAMALALVPLGAWLIVDSKRPVTLDPLALGALIAACIPLLQFRFGLIYFLGDAVVACAYLVGFALAVLTGARLEEAYPGRLVNVLFAAFGLAAILSVGIELYQWQRLDDLGLLISNLGTLARPFGNLNQPNQLATLLAWGLVAIWWAYLSGRVRGWIAASAAAYILLGMVLTQSRTAWLHLLVIGVAAWFYRGPLRTRRYAVALVAAAIAFLVAVLAWAAVSLALHSSAFVPLEGRAGFRGLIWSQMLDALSLRPWTGYGWNQVGIAQIAVALDQAMVPELLEHTHNLALDLLVWNGALVGPLIAGGLGLWVLRQMRRAETPAGCLLLLAILLLLAHSMVELPHDYAYFLLPAGLMMGALSVLHRGAPARMTIPRWGAAGLMAGASALLAAIAIDYAEVERNLLRYRFESAHIGNAHNGQPPELMVLTQFQGFLTFVRTKPEPGMSPDQLKAMGKVAERYPSHTALFAYARMAAMNDQPELARTAMRRLCKMHGTHCANALRAWQRMAASESPQLASVPLADLP